jgi:tetratricopeptide (TPR) repeat protein
MTGDRSKTLQTLRERYLVEYRGIYRKSDRIAFFEAISETAAAANVLFWRSFANAMSAWLRKDLGAALAFSEDAIALAPECAFPWNGKGNVLQRQRRHEEALAAYEKAIELEPDYADAWSGKGNALQGQGHYAEAAVAFGRATALRKSQKSSS